MTNLIAIIYKVIFTVLSAMAIVFIIYLITIMSKIKSGKCKELPIHLKAFSDVLDRFKTVKVVKVYFERQGRLVYGGLEEARIYSSLVILVWIPSSTVLFMLTRLTTTVWYYTVINLLICTIMPLLITYSKLNAEADKIRYKLRDTYKVFVTYIGEDRRIMPIVSRICETTNGKVKTVWMNFSKEYPVNRDKAYDDLERTVGDIFIKNFVHALKSFEREGTDIAETLQITASRTETTYYSKIANRGTYSGARLFISVYGIVAVLICYSPLLFMKMLSLGIPSEKEDLLGNFYYIALAYIFMFLISFKFEND